LLNPGSFTPKALFPFGIARLRNSVYPVGTPAWTMRLQIAFLFPELTEEKMMLEKKLKQMEEPPPQKK